MASREIYRLLVPRKVFLARGKPKKKYKNGNFIHGEARKTGEYNTWAKMKNRCLNPNAPDYPRYGGRGITVCSRWLRGEGKIEGYQCFLKDVGRRPSSEHQLERKNNSKGYSPENCKWATRTEQGGNKRNNFLITYGGETLWLNEWARRVGL